MISRVDLTRSLIVACLSRSRRTGTEKFWNTTHAATPTVDSRRWDPAVTRLRLRSKFSCIQSICVIVCDDADLSDSRKPVYIQTRSEDLQDRSRVSAGRHLHQVTASSGFPASSSHYHGRVSLNYIWYERRARLLWDS